MPHRSSPRDKGPYDGKQGRRDSEPGREKTQARREDVVNSGLSDDFPSVEAGVVGYSVKRDASYNGPAREDERA
jgi:hypothetical protein